MTRSQGLHMLAWTAALALILVWWVPAWHHWQQHDQTTAQLASQRLEMLAQQAEAQVLRQKTRPQLAQAQKVVLAIVREQIGGTATVTSNTEIRVSLQAVPAERLYRAWQDIREQTGARAVQADLQRNGPLWTGTLVFQLVQQP